MSQIKQNRLQSKFKKNKEKIQSQTKTQKE
jgi:hypothetical protein